MASSAPAFFILAIILGVGVNVVRGGTINIMRNGPIGVETSDRYVGYECVREVTITIHGAQAAELETSCGPTSNSNINGVFQYGTSFALIPIPGTNNYEGLFNVGTSCLKIKYFVVLGYRIRIYKSRATETSDQQCVNLITGNNLNRFVSSRATHSVQKSAQVFKPMTAGTGFATKKFKGSGALQVDTEDFEDNDECVRVVTVRVHGAQAERLETSCGVTQGRIDGERFQYGKSFTFKQIPGTHRYIGLFNSGDFCTKKSYYVDKGYPVTISKSQGTIAVDAECRGLMVGENLIDDDDDDYEDILQHVIVRDRSSRLYRSKNVMGSGPIRVESLDHTEDDECTRELTIKVHGAEAETVETSCHSAYQKHNNQQFQYGKSFFFKRIAGTRNYRGLFNVGEYCVRKTYYVNRGYPITISKSKGTITNDDECLGLIGGDHLVHDVDITDENASDPKSGWLEGFTSTKTH